MKRRILLAILPVLTCSALLPRAQAVSPVRDCPDYELLNFTTAEGCKVLNLLTTGAGNTALGFQSLFFNTTGNFNTGVGAATLVLNNGDSNTATGAAALLLNTSGINNTASGTDAMGFNNTGDFNDAFGAFALVNNVDGFSNNAFGESALFFNITGAANTAVGDLALENNDSTGAGLGNFNTAVGAGALRNNVDGSGNVAVGDEAGTSIVSASNMVAIGAPGAGPFADISNTCFIGSIHNQPVSDPGSALPVFVDQFNVLGFIVSSKRFKHDIQPMDNASEVLLSLKPVTFKYNSDKNGKTQYGLIAEEVAKVAPDLVFRDKNGDVETVRFEQVNSMLLNEFLKEHKKVEEQQATIAELKSTVVQRQKGMEVFTAQLKEQAAQIQKVSAQLEMSKPVAKVVVNKP